MNLFVEFLCYLTDAHWTGDGGLARLVLGLPPTLSASLLRFRRCRSPFGWDTFGGGGSVINISGMGRAVPPARVALSC